VVRRVVQALGGLRLAGFYTQEVRERGQRVGFAIVGLGGDATGREGREAVVGRDPAHREAHNAVRLLVRRDEQVDGALRFGAGLALTS
jgi:nucleoside-triphosphatase THEP1